MTTKDLINAINAFKSMNDIHIIQSIQEISKKCVDLDQSDKINIYSIDIFNNHHESVKYKFKGILFKQDGLNIYKVLNGTNTWIVQNLSARQMNARCLRLNEE